MLNKILIILVLLTTLLGCSSKTIMSSVDSDVRDVMLIYGPPVNIFDVEDGLRAFQWVSRKKYIEPTIANRTEVIHHSTGLTEIRSMQTQSRIIETSCFYTLFSIWDETKQAWVITSSREPIKSCKFD